MSDGFRLFCVWLAHRIFSYSTKIHVLGKENLPKSDAFLLTSNHISHFDPPLLSCIVPRYIEWIAMKELFRGPIGKRFFHWLGAIPVDRAEADSKILRKAIHRLKCKTVIGIFPEGGLRSGKDSLLQGAPGKPGFATLSILSGTPIVPCVILGSDRLYKPQYWNPKQRIFGKGKRAPVWIAFGSPIQPDPSLPKQQARNQIHTQTIASIQSLANALQKHFGLQPEDFPQTAQQRRKEPFSLL